MTEGEKLVWAAVFARESSLRDPPPNVLTPGGNAWRAWEEDQIATAVEIAGGAVDYMREIQARVAEGHGKSSRTMMYLHEMIYG